MYSRSISKVHVRVYIWNEQKFNHTKYNHVENYVSEIWSYIIWLWTIIRKF